MEITKLTNVVANLFEEIDLLEEKILFDERELKAISKLFHCFQLLEIYL